MPLHTIRTVEVYLTTEPAKKRDWEKISISRSDQTVKFGFGIAQSSASASSRAYISKKASRKKHFQKTPPGLRVWIQGQSFKCLQRRKKYLTQIILIVYGYKIWKESIKTAGKWQGKKCKSHLGIDEILHLARIKSVLKKLIFFFQIMKFCRKRGEMRETRGEARFF